MKRLLLLALALLLPLSSQAAPYGMILTDGTNTVRLYEAACVHAATVGLLKPQMRPKFRKASGVFNGKFFNGCWTYEEDGPQVFILYEDGDQQRYDASRFEPDVGI